VSVEEETPLPEFDQEFISRIFSALSEMEMTLDENPLQFGPRRLNSKVATARDMLTETEQIYNQITHLLQLYKRAHRSSEQLVNFEVENLLANDPEVRSGRNLETSKAIARVKIRSAGEYEDPSIYQTVIEDLIAVLSVVKAKRADMKDLQARLRDQIKLCHEEIGLGERWGSKPPPGAKVPSLDTTTQEARTTVKELREMFLKEAQASGEDPEEAPESQVQGQEAPEPKPGDPSSLGDLLGGAEGDGESDEFLEALGENLGSKATRSAGDLEAILQKFGV
jgi:hypothetical protein